MESGKYLKPVFLRRVTIIMHIGREQLQVTGQHAMICTILETASYMTDLHSLNQLLLQGSKTDHTLS